MTRLTILLAAASAAALAACETGTAALDTEPAVAGDPPVEAAGEAVDSAAETAMDTAADAAEQAGDVVAEAAEAAMPEMGNAERLDAILAAQPEDVQARYDHRNPAETVAFFGIEPGMTVVEALPGGGWYTKILLPYLGPEGKLVGAHYPDAVWSKLQPDNEEWVAQRIESTAKWPDMAAEWDIDGAAEIGSYSLTEAPDDMAGKADAVLFIRALHNLHRFNPDTGLFTDMLAETYEVVKPGGVVGVVQHRAPETNSDAWADGSAGYLKQSRLIEAFEAAGFVLEEASEMNANPADVPSEEDFVWRLPPSLASTEEGTPERAAMEAIGESDRMTLRFRKPA